MDAKALLPFASAFVGVLGGLLVAFISLRGQRDTLKRELEFQRIKLEEELRHQKERLEAEFGIEESVESALRYFLGLHDLPYRSFQMIQHHIGGFESNELRRLLVRSGAVRFKAADGTEMWALLERVKEEFEVGRWQLRESPRNKVPPEQLFPGLFSDKSER